MVVGSIARGRRLFKTDPQGREKRLEVAVQAEVGRQLRRKQHAAAMPLIAAAGGCHRPRPAAWECQDAGDVRRSVRQRRVRDLHTLAQGRRRASVTTSCCIVRQPEQRSAPSGVFRH